VRRRTIRLEESKKIAKEKSENSDDMRTVLRPRSRMLLKGDEGGLGGHYPLGHRWRPAMTICGHIKARPSARLRLQGLCAGTPRFERGPYSRRRYPASTLQRNRLSAAARFRRRGNDLGAFHSLRVGEAGGELLRGSPPLSGASVFSASRLEPLVPCMGLSESSRDLSSPPLSFFRPIPLFDRGDHPFVPTRASLTFPGH
jgi:hypothetical protein